MMICTLALNVQIYITGVILLVLISSILYTISCYKRCPSNKAIVVYGRVPGGVSAKCTYGGGVFVWPVIQDYMYLSLETITIEDELKLILSQDEERFDIKFTCHVGISTKPELLQAAAQRLLGLSNDEITYQARDILLGQMRLAAAELPSVDLANISTYHAAALKKGNAELGKIGITIIGLSILDYRPRNQDGSYK